MYTISIAVKVRKLKYVRLVIDSHPSLFYLFPSFSFLLLSFSFLLLLFSCLFLNPEVWKTL